MYGCLTGSSIKRIPLPGYGREVIWNFFFFLLNISQICLSLLKVSVNLPVI